MAKLLVWLAIIFLLNGLKAQAPENNNYHQVPESMGNIKSSMTAVLRSVYDPTSDTTLLRLTAHHDFGYLIGPHQLFQAPSGGFFLTFPSDSPDLYVTLNGAESGAGDISFYFPTRQSLELFLKSEQPVDEPYMHSVLIDPIIYRNSIDSVRPFLAKTLGVPLSDLTLDASGVRALAKALDDINPYDRFNSSLELNVGMATVMYIGEILHRNSVTGVQFTKRKNSIGYTPKPIDYGHVTFNWYGWLVSNLMDEDNPAPEVWLPFVLDMGR